MQLENNNLNNEFVNDISTNENKENVEINSNIELETNKESNENLDSNVTKENINISEPNINKDTENINKESNLSKENPSNTGLNEFRNRQDTRLEEKLLAEYALETSKGKNGDEFIEYAINNPQKYPKRVVDSVINKLTDGKVNSYEEFNYLKNLPEEDREEYEKTVSNPVVKKLKEYVDNTEKEKDFQLYMKLAKEAGMIDNYDKFEDKYINDKVFQTVYKSLIDTGRDKETAIRYAIKTIDPYAFDRKTPSNIDIATSTPSTSKVVPIEKTIEKEKTLFSTRFVNPLTDW